MFTWLALAFIAGGIIPLQAAANGNLKLQMDSPFLAVVVSCSVGVGVLSVLIVVAGESFYRPLDLLLTKCREIPYA